MTNILAKLENMPLTYTPRDGWELFDEITGEIFSVETEHAGIMLRNMAIQRDEMIWTFSAVRSNHPNAWDEFKSQYCMRCGKKYDDRLIALCEECYEITHKIFTCQCCGTPLHQIDPDTICMDCVDMNCNVKDDNNV